MTRDDIIRMAREAGWSWMEAGMEARKLQRFAALVADAKYAEHQQTLALQQRSYEREIEIEVEAEREACAKLCEEIDANSNVVLHHAIVCAETIRARGNT